MNKAIELRGDNWEASTAAGIVDQIQKCVIKAVRTGNPVTLYVGHKQYYSMRMLEPPTAAIMGLTDVEFMGVRYFRVIQDNYLRCV